MSAVAKWVKISPEELTFERNEDSEGTFTVTNGTLSKIAVRTICPSFSVICDPACFSLKPEEEKTIQVKYDCLKREQRRTRRITLLFSSIDRFSKTVVIRFLWNSVEVAEQNDTTDDEVRENPEEIVADPEEKETGNPENTSPEIDTPTGEIGPVGNDGNPVPKVEKSPRKPEKNPSIATKTTKTGPGGSNGTSLPSKKNEKMKGNRTKDPKPEPSIRNNDDPVPTEESEKPPQNHNLAPETTSVKCKICDTPYKEDVADRTPRILIGCGHTVCEECARKLTVNQEIKCPFDRSITKNFEGNVKNLPKNFDILEIPNNQREKRADSISEEPVLCGIQCAENSNHEAVVFCDWCKADLCDECFNQLHSAKTLSGHKKIPIAMKPIQMPKCPNHPDNTAEFLCEADNCEMKKAMMCHTCLLLDHKDHPYIALKKRLMENATKIGEWIEKVKKKEADYESDLVKKRTIIKSYNTSSAGFKVKCKEVADYFDEKKKKALEALERFVNDEANAIATEEIFLEKMLKETVQVKERMERVLKAKSELHLFDEISREASRICAGSVGRDLHVPIGFLRIEWKNGTELFL